MVETITGVHPFRPQCLVEAILGEQEADGLTPDRAAVIDIAQELLSLIDNRQCPRCSGAYRPHELPNGSRVTPCRCIPICKTCNRAESLEAIVVADIAGPEDSILLAVIADRIGNWPVDGALQRMALDEFDRRHTPRFGRVVEGPNSL
jgi:hypothetical protein